MIDEKALEAAARACLHRRIKPDWFETKDGAWVLDHDKVIAETAITAYLQALSPGSTGEMEGWQDLMKELADELQIEIDSRYPPDSRHYPSIARKAYAAMEPVRQARAMLAAAGGRE